MKWLVNFYNWFWYNVQSLWIKSKKLRRPFTYLMRDFILKHPVWSVVIILIQYGLLIWLTWWCWIAGVIVMPIYFLVMGHLVWGNPMKLGQQEYPEYIED